MKNIQQLPSYTFTKQGYDDVKKEYEILLASRPAAVEDLSKARSLGDLKENGYYKAARMKLNSVDHRLRQLKLFIKYGKIIEPSGKDTVGIGNSVVLNDGTKERIFSIVGSYEANPSEGKVSDRSPIGHALIGKKVGDIIEIVVPSGTIHYTLKKIS
jgi:transcription elongation factor GreA